MSVKCYLNLQRIIQKYLNNYLTPLSKKSYSSCKLPYFMPEVLGEVQRLLCSAFYYYCTWTLTQATNL